MACDSPFWVLPKAGLEKVPVPCGRCPPCKLRRVNSWVFRLLQEELQHSHAHFVTLTYATQHVPITDNGFMTLTRGHETVKIDPGIYDTPRLCRWPRKYSKEVDLCCFTKYMKRLRKLTDVKGLKYFVVGEYGSANLRPHWHAIVFGVEDPQHFVDAWGLGEVHIGSVTGDSVAYCMKYIDKPHRIPVHDRDDRVPEFSLMSKGLGKNYLTDSMVDYHKADLSRLYATKEGGHRIALPRYYRQKIYSEDEQRRQARLAQSVSEAKEVESLAQYHATYGRNNVYTYEQWKDSQRFGRYSSFYKKMKPRNV